MNSLLYSYICMIGIALNNFDSIGAFHNHYIICYSKYTIQIIKNEVCMYTPRVYKGTRV